ncbi:SIMPL domain-containing protein [Solitalea longa]|uniref:SIMPL domain-containing protein n=1 Tax=Solitalea longa TaxID=2079460 RepID=A0A2S4ZXH1_9SPHI|nr:SIMPL domain-containing protein [Solitalea longa]POY35061.1 SIMPL domain-containing protein [Solitalea longa]
MKRLIASIALIAAGFSTMAQTAVVNPVKKIEVTGTAEMEIVPDIIYLNIALKEYYKDNNNKNKVAIEAVEKQLQQAVIDAGVPKENFMLDNVYGYNYDWNIRDKKRDPNFLARKQYRLKLTKLDKVNDILSAVDPKGIESVNVAEYTHSKIDDFKKELKIKAMKDAKEKAAYLVTAIGEQLGGVLEIYDNESQPVYYPRPMMAMYKSADAMGAAEAMPEIDFKSIKLKSDVRLIFSIK